MLPEEKKKDIPDPHIDVVTGQRKKIANLNAYHVFSRTDVPVCIGETQNVPLAVSFFNHLLNPT
jgi:hypothetical protein